MTNFIPIDPRFLKSLERDSIRIPTLYYSNNLLVRHFFWQRLKFLFEMLENNTNRRELVVDFGGGSGVFLPSLAQLFSNVVCIDAHTLEAEQVLQHFGLEEKVSVLKLIVGRDPLPSGLLHRADAVIAADVLEHFQDLSMCVDAVKSLLRASGALFTSLPTETLAYRTARRIFRVQAPDDHYHNARSVEAFLEESGFRKFAARTIPFDQRLLPLFSIGGWQMFLDDTFTTRSDQP